MVDQPSRRDVDLVVFAWANPSHDASHRVRRTPTRKSGSVRWPVS